ncbi:MAG: hypothetical protein H6737_19675 [Alphaproteobacteria bacterium]|nr:hypothetical protein [Alphaproteobacteria bacterium]
MTSLRPVSCLLASNVILDTDHITHIQGVIEVLTAPDLPAMVPTASLFAAWEASGEVEELEARVRVERPDGTEVVLQDWTSVGKKLPGLVKLRVLFQGLQLSQAGRSNFCADARISKGSETSTVSYPVIVKIFTE